MHLERSEHKRTAETLRRLYPYVMPLQAIQLTTCVQISKQMSVRYQATTRSTKFATFVTHGLARKARFETMFEEYIIVHMNRLFQLSRLAGQSHLATSKRAQD